MPDSVLTDADRAKVVNAAEAFSAAFGDPATVAGKLADWIRTNLPERVSSAVWVTARLERDEGIAVEIHELTLGQRMKAQLSGLIGQTSAGLAGTVAAYKSAKGVTFSVGAGAVVRYSDLRDIRPVLVVKGSW